MPFGWLLYHAVLLNAVSAIYDKLSPPSIEIRLLQPENAFWPINVILFGIVTETNPSQP